MKTSRSPVTDKKHKRDMRFDRLNKPRTYGRCLRRNQPWIMTPTKCVNLCGGAYACYQMTPHRGREVAREEGPQGLPMGVGRYLDWEEQGQGNERITSRENRRISSIRISFARVSTTLFVKSACCKIFQIEVRDIVSGSNCASNLERISSRNSRGSFWTRLIINCR